LKNEQSIYAVTAKSKVVLSCIGPYEKAGEVVIKACVSLGTHYVDITGEGQWVERMRERYHAMAEQNNVVLVPFAVR